MSRFQIFDLIRGGTLEEIEQFLQRNPKQINMRNPYSNYNYTPLHEAVCTERTDVVQLLIKFGAQVNIKCAKYNRTPLHLAVSQGLKFENIKILVKYGAQVNAKDKEGKTPLELAVSYPDNEQTVKFLLEYGADINSEDENLYTPLYGVVFCAEKNYVKMMLNKRIHVSINLELIGELIRSSDEKCIQILLNHFIKLKQLNILEDEQVYSELRSTFFSEDWVLYEEACEAEVHKMKAKLICADRNLTFEDLLSKPLRKIATFLSLSDVRLELFNFFTINYCKLFPIYATFLKVRIREASEATELLNKTEKFLKNISGDRLSSVVVREISNYLTIEDIKILDEAHKG